MKSNNHNITDEHIVAYLDGELNASPEFERELRADPALATAAKEYAAIGKSMAGSRADSRFMLSASVDTNTKKMLADSLKKSRKAIRTAAPAPNAAPVRSIPATRSIKFVWAKRASVGFAFATLLAFLWFNFTGKNEQITQVPVPSPAVQAPVGIPEAPAPAVPAPVVSGQLADAANHAATAAHGVRKNVETQQNLPSRDLATNTTHIEAPPATTEQAKADPADVMISHRYAKMIKATRVVEVTQQDQM